MVGPIHTNEPHDSLTPIIKELKQPLTGSQEIKKMKPLPQTPTRRSSTNLGGGGY